MTPAMRGAVAVHLLTASGAVFAMLALVAAVDQNWSSMFLWLIIALAVDAIDGPLARRFDVGRNAPRFDGVLLDLIVDYLTYVVIPAYAMFASGLLPGWPGWAAMLVISYASALYFADTRMKTADKSFNGFPACWNMVALVIFVLKPPVWAGLSVVAVLAVAMFMPLRFVHPLRTRRWRAFTLPVTLVWLGLAVWAALQDFALPAAGLAGLAVASGYLMLAGIAQQWTGQDQRP
jgi:phosphatidylcholine synthase